LLYFLAKKIGEAKLVKKSFYYFITEKQGHLLRRFAVYFKLVKRLEKQFLSNL